MSKYDNIFMFKGGIVRMNKKIILLFLTLMVLTFASATSTLAVEFSDLSKDHWAYENITTLANKGVINGYPDGTYLPENSVTRGEFLKLILTASVGNKAFESNSNSSEHWAMKYASYAEENDLLMMGTSIDNLDDGISRLEMAVILARVSLVKGFDEYDTSARTDFSDIADLPNGGDVYIKYVASLGLLNGYPDGTFGPNKTMTRAEVATVISRFLQKDK